jgi:hypothetical protein
MVELMTRKHSTAVLYSLENSVEVLEVFPDKLLNRWVFWDCFVSTAWELVSRRRALDRDIVNVRDSDFWDFWL